MAFASLFHRSSRRPASQRQLERATKSVVENLEGRLMLSTSRHRTTLSASETLSGGIIRAFTAAPTGTDVTQIHHLYGVDTLDTLSTTNPLFTNSGNGQPIIVIGSPVSFPNDIPAGRKGNINLFSAGMGIPGASVFEDPIVEAGFTQPTDNIGDIETTMALEWAHAMAPLASLVCVEVPSTNGVVSANDMSLGIQEAVRQGQLLGSPGPINQFLPGSVVLMPLSTRGEDATLTQMFDSLFSYKYAANSTFIAPAGEVGGTVSMPANSPWVTSVGGTTFLTDAAGNRTFEIADLNAGGGASGVEPLPAFQRGLTVNGTRLRTRGSPDISLAANTVGEGMDVYWDPTANGSVPTPWTTVDGTAVASAEFAGMVADVNELRVSNGLGLIGRDLNNELYAAARNNPNVVHDITQGNNTLFAAGRGYDLATGLGAPQADLLIPALAGVATQNASANLTGDLFLANNGVNTGNLVIPLRGTASVEIGTLFVTISNFQMTGSSSSTANGVTTNTPFLATFTPIGLLSISGSTLSGTGTVTITGGGNETFNVAITGKISGSRNRARRLNAQIFTVNTRGKKVPFGAQDVFQATLSM